MTKDIGFDTLLRLDKIISDLYDKIFYFDTKIFNLNNEYIRIYFDLNEKFKEDEELLELLKENGKYFTNKISNDPSLKEVYERYLSLN
ncbi:hypothetical protein [Staphylococcus pseudintermedius]|uniref:hypothetical protein n=1 Tax=Staphylococcus pseudintermedius TaxID=283734 RepID=UPI0011595ACC|nr:hypothetical protein [Staphylococcus pseudintermedius]EIE3738931.1 hypothetical protein [Staphylococcus pseudintermedius]EIQ3887642.1 hypothetical protein [Staphylococcus pseudintermedius]EJE1172212.1 hypothetical protein [Staphylococcus pseudintermedius]EKO8578053.1 hypothetical protein [Staphylococcus pseudintermedius]MCE5450939.1 hypothetical protein [Staphylococcus pseudintermedius]